MPSTASRAWCHTFHMPPRQVVEGFNRDPEVHGILVQLPLPGHVSEARVLDAISLEKDVDGFSPANVGALAMRGREPLYVSCTPKVRRRAAAVTDLPANEMLLQNTRKVLLSRLLVCCPSGAADAHS